MKFFVFRKYGDSLLFALAIAVLATALFYSLRGPAVQAEPASVVFAQWWQEDLDGNALEDLIAEFESQHEGIRIILIEKSYEDMRSALFAPGGDAPGDILALDPLWVPELLGRGVIESAGAPILAFINVLYYNIDILREAGFARPPQTRGEFLAFARAVAGAGRGAHALGLGLGGNSARGIHDSVYPWIWAAGARLVHGGNPVASSAPVVQSLSFLASLNSEGLIAPGAFHADSKSKLEDFISGRTAFMVAPTRHVALVRERMGEGAFNITSVPTLDNQMVKPFVASAGWTLGIRSGSAHAEEARLFAAFLAERPQHLSSNARGKVPSSPPPDPIYSNIWEIALAGEAADDFSGIAGKHMLEEIFREELSALFAGTSSPAETAAAIQQRWLAVLGTEITY